MGKWLLLVETNCKDKAREAEFNDWYDNIHLPDILEAPGFVRANRYENPEPAEGRGKYIAAYEIETDDYAACMKNFGEHMAKKREQGRMSELVEIISEGRALYKWLSFREE